MLLGKTRKISLLKKNNPKARLQTCGSWYIQKARYQGMTDDLTIFATLSKQKGGHVTFGDNSKGKIIRVGNNHGYPSRLIENMYLVDKLKYNRESF